MFYISWRPLSIRRRLIRTSMKLKCLAFILHTFICAYNLSGDHFAVQQYEISLFYSYFQRNTIYLWTWLKLPIWSTLFLLRKIVQWTKTWTWVSGFIFNWRPRFRSQLRWKNLFLKSYCGNFVTDIQLIT